MERLDKLGNYFVYFRIYERFNITFETFVYMVNNDVWQRFIDDHQSLGIQMSQAPGNVHDEEKFNMTKVVKLKRYVRVRRVL